MSIATDVSAIIDEMTSGFFFDEGISVAVTYSSFAAVPTLNTSTMKSSDTATTATMFGVWSDETRPGDAEELPTRSLMIPKQDFTDASMTPKLNDTLAVASVIYRLQEITTDVMGVFYDLKVARQ
jgi:hypothetical protein